MHGGDGTAVPHPNGGSSTPDDGACCRRYVIWFNSTFYDPSARNGRDWKLASVTCDSVNNHEAALPTLH
jgi:hypothetical protein